MRILVRGLIDWPESVARHLGWLAPLFARITVGWVFLLSGWGKLHNLPQVTENFIGWGIPFPHLLTPFVSGIEFFGGLFLLLGLLTRISAGALGVVNISGGTFTITNPGPFGTFLTVPVIAQPQVAILSTDGVKRRPVVVATSDGGEAIAIHAVGMLALSFDHRAVDGAYASAFLRDVAKVIETRDWAAEL